MDPREQERHIQNMLHSCFEMYYESKVMKRFQKTDTLKKEHLFFLAMGYCYLIGLI